MDKSLSISVIAFLCAVIVVGGVRSLENIFIGHKLTGKEWLQFKYNVNCWTRQGRWDLNKSLGYQFDKSMNYMLNYNKASPCQLFNEGTICNQALEGNNEHYQWTPAQKCKNNIDLFTSASFCSLNMIGNIMIVGDSMNELLSKVWTNEIAFQTSNQEICSEYHSLRKVSLKCNAPSGTTFYNFRNDRLSLTDTSLIDRTRNIYEMSWAPLLSTLNISLLILNRGAHYVNDTTLISEVKTTLAYLRKNHPHVGVIWRNTPYGHHNYATHFLDAPLAVPDPEDVTQAPSGFHYGEIQTQNKMIRELLQFSFPEVLYLDVATATVLRRDSHRDPLHYCVIGGPVLHWVHLIFSIIKWTVQFPFVGL